MESQNMVSWLPDMYGVNENVLCECCEGPKSTRDPGKVLKQSMARGTFHKVYNDVADPIEIASIKGTRYFVTLLDEYKRYSKVWCVNKTCMDSSSIKEMMLKLGSSDDQKI